MQPLVVVKAFQSEAHGILKNEEEEFVACDHPLLQNMAGVKYGEKFPPIHIEIWGDIPNVEREAKCKVRATLPIDDPYSHPWPGKKTYAGHWILHGTKLEEKTAPGEDKAVYAIVPEDPEYMSMVFRDLLRQTILDGILIPAMEIHPAESSDPDIFPYWLVDLWVSVVRAETASTE